MVLPPAVRGKVPARAVDAAEITIAAMSMERAARCMVDSFDEVVEFDEGLIARSLHPS
jgi:hypothetical protein